MLSNSYKNSHRNHTNRILQIHQMIFQVTECIPQIILRLWRFLCVRDTERRGNKITVYNEVKSMC